MVKETSEKISYTYSFKVNRSDSLLTFLLNKLSLSRNSVKALLHDRKVLVNGNVISQFDYPLAKDDEVKIAKNPVKRNNIVQVNNSFKKLIIYEDEYFLAINKPSGMLSVQSDKDRNSAYSLAIDYLSQKNKKARVYALHRIDKDTSGVLLFCKDIKLHSKLKTHWNEDIKEREYIAVVNGRIEPDKDRIVSYLNENRNNMVYVAKQGKKAITNYETIKANKNYSLLRVKIETGRKNQIRVQLADRGFSIVGDNKYGDGLSPFNRLGLHASTLSFINPVDHKLITIKASIPAEFNKLFK